MRADGSGGCNDFAQIQISIAKHKGRTMATLFPSV